MITGGQHVLSIRYFNIFLYKNNYKYPSLLSPLAGGLWYTLNRYPARSKVRGQVSCNAKLSRRAESSLPPLSRCATNPWNSRASLAMIHVDGGSYNADDLSSDPKQGIAQTGEIGKHI